MKFWKIIIGPLIALGLLASACGTTANRQPPDHRDTGNPWRYNLNSKWQR